MSDEQQGQPDDREPTPEWQSASSAAEMVRQDQPHADQSEPSQDEGQVHCEPEMTRAPKTPISQSSIGGPSRAKRAAQAMVHTILVVIYALLTQEQESYHDLGGHYFDGARPAPRPAPAGTPLGGAGVHDFVGARHPRRVTPSYPIFTPVTSDDEQREFPLAR